ncbi:MAG TPA: hypothetical protein VEC19_20295 [Usitatibacter sp.]|nr:hypothetical protein [Usitatibacter sp.]
MKVLALLIGVVLLAIGVAGFVPAFTADGVLFNVIPMDTVRSVLFLVTGLVGIAIGVSRRRGVLPPSTGERDMRTWM